MSVRFIMYDPIPWAFGVEIEPIIKPTLDMWLEYEPGPRRAFIEVDGHYEYVDEGDLRRLVWFLAAACPGFPGRSIGETS